MTTQMSGESPWFAIVHDNSLDIEEEESFTEYLMELGFGGVYKRLPPGGSE